MFVFRNNTIERFFPRDYKFSGYEDISFIPQDSEGYVWFYQAPVKYDFCILADQIRGYLKNLTYVLSKVDNKKSFIILTMHTLYSVPFTDDDYRLHSAVEEYNLALYELEHQHSNIKILDITEFTSSYNLEELIDWKFYFISQMGINPRLSRDFLSWWQKKLNSIALKRKKCLVLDLDNTLWGGILGEDGVEGIKIGGDYPGNAFLCWQEALLELSKTGVILTVCSKNNEDDVIEAWEKNPYMILKKDHFAAYRINWVDKATNIQELSKELNIGLDSFVFIDDNPTERSLIQQLLPMVCVPDFPTKPYELPGFFKRIVNDYFKVYCITKEDQQKTEQYKANAQRAQAATHYSDFTDFLESLDIQICIEGATEFNATRIAQMTQKTNQFNLTTKRYSDTDIRLLMAQAWKIWCISVADKFGDNGITGAIIITPDGIIDSFLLSCRILGKGIEFAFIKKIFSILYSEGIVQLKASYVPTSKNTQVKEFWDKCGFSLETETSDGERIYSIDLANANKTIEEYYHIIVK